MSAIDRIFARQILDSRGRPTAEVDVITKDGHLGRAAVPSGASTGTYEAHERRDRNEEDYAGLSVHCAVDAVNQIIAPAASGKEVSAQTEIDELLGELDGTPNLSRLGANAVLGVSLAVCRAAALDERIPLHRWIADLAGSEPRLPMPMVNILSGGMHSRNGMDVQDFLVVPMSATSTYEALHNVERIRRAATELCTEMGLSVLLADEGGLSPGFSDSRQALDLMVASFERARLEPGRDAAIAIDVAAHTLAAPDGTYRFSREGMSRTSEEMLEMISSWISNYPIISIEDALDEEDWAAWTKLTEQHGVKAQLIGDDLFTTNAERLRHGIEVGAANGVLVKLNQNGTLSGTIDVVDEALDAGYVPVISARSGETEDPFLADFAVGLGTGQIKVGSVRSSERLAKYNQLLRIGEDESLAFSAPPFEGGRR